MKALLLVVVAAITAPLGFVGPASGRATAVSAPPPLIDDSSWEVRHKALAGLGSGTSLDAVARADGALLLAGARPVGRSRAWRAAIWSSADGDTWRRAAVPTTPGEVSAIAARGPRAIAIGTRGGGVSDFVWTSKDGGHRWTRLAAGAHLFGTPAPEMGRPFVSAVRATNGGWIASGGGADGYAAVWRSADGSRWRQVLDSGDVRVAGSVDVTTSATGGLFGYWTTAGWYARDGRTWGPRVNLSVPDRSYLRTVAPGARVAFGDSFDRHGLPTPLLRSTDNGRSWSVDPRFLAQFHDASVVTIARARGLWVATGTSGVPNHPDAWVSADLVTWRALPATLRGAPGGMLGLVGVLGDRVVMLGTAPELDRYYILDVTR